MNQIFSYHQQNVKKRTKNTYHPALIIAQQKNILPHDFLKLIPKSTKYSHRNYDCSKIIGFSLFNQDDILNNITNIMTECAKNKKIIKICIAVINIYKIIIKIKNTIILNNKYAQSKINELTVTCINKIRNTIRFKKALKFFKISKEKFYNISLQVKNFCSDSLFNKCFNIWTNQLSVKEVNKIKQLCEDPQFKGWTIASIAYFAKRNNILNICLGTWYKYVHLLNINKKPPKCRKKYKIGIRAIQPNQIIHADVTIVTTMDNIKSYVYLIQDNFSRFILNFKTSTKLSAYIRKQTFDEAVKTYLIPNADFNTDFITDGGPENVNNIIKDFFNNSQYTIEQKIAQKDIPFSNSIIEACNKQLKYRCLHLYDIPDFEALIMHLERFIPIFNYKMPHYSLKGLTPYEVYTNQKLDMDILDRQMKIAYKNRIEDNKKYRCNTCNN